MQWITVGGRSFNLANVTFVDHPVGDAVGKVFIHLIGQPINGLAPQPQELEGEDAKEFMRRLAAVAAG